MGCQGNYAILHNQSGLSFEEYIILRLSGATERIYINKKMSEVLNVGLITPWDTSLSNVFFFILKYTLMLMNMQMR